PRLRRHARAACTRRSDAWRPDHAFSRCRRALALRAHPLAEYRRHDAIATVDAPPALAGPRLCSRAWLRHGADVAAAAQRGTSSGSRRAQTMSSAFRAVQWNRTKLVYDGILLVGVTLYIGGYLILAHWLDPPKDLPAAIDLCIRAFGTCAFF